MGHDQIAHLKELRQAYEKRLRVLELKEAQQGQDTPASLLIEIKEYRQKIAEIDEQAINLGDLPTAKQGIVIDTFNQYAITRRKRVEIEFEGDFNNLTPEVLSALVRAVAAMAEIPYDQVRVVKVSSGSIRLVVDIPEDAAEKLLGIYNSKEPLIEELSIVQINIEKEEHRTEGSDYDYRTAFKRITDAIRTALPQISEGDAAQIVVILIEEISERISNGESLAFVSRETDENITLSVLDLKSIRKRKE